MTVNVLWLFPIVPWVDLQYDCGISCHTHFRFVLATSVDLGEMLHPAFCLKSSMFANVSIKKSLVYKRTSMHVLRVLCLDPHLN